MKKSILLVCGLLSLTSCAREISSDVYTARQVGEVSMTYAGVIQNVRAVTVEHGESLGDNELGAVGGGVAGGLVGSAVGRGNAVPVVAGVIAGAVAGTFIEKRVKQQNALEYIVQLDNGGLMTVVQGEDQVFQIGEPVYVQMSPRGRSRVIAQ